jgi:hypothetical protein
MLPHEFQARANMQSQGQCLQRLQFEAWCRVANTVLPTFLRFEVRIGGNGFNHIHLRNGHFPGSGIFSEVLQANQGALQMQLGREGALALLVYLETKEAKALYELELFAGEK